MTLEHTERKPGITLEELGSLADQKELRLPKSIRAYIRRLKADGQFERAMAVAREVRERKLKERQQNAEKELYRSIRELLETKDPQVQAVEEIRAIWLLYASGVIDSDEKTAELLVTLDSKSPDLKAFLEGRLIDIREELRPLLPPEKESIKRGIRRF